MTTLYLPPTCFVAFVDEAGHECLRDSRHPVYGLGGCGVLARELTAYLEDPWRSVRKAVSGSTAATLHAAESRAPTSAQIAAIAGFFQSGSFCRFAVVCSDQTLFPDGFPPVRAVAGCLKQRIVDVARWTGFTEIAVVFEHASRTTKLLEREFGDFAAEEGGSPLPTTCFVMAKAAGQPALEVADFVMHAVGRQARYRATHGKGFLPDFAATFHGIDRRLVSFMEISRVVEGERA